MRYIEFAELYEKLSNVGGKLEKADILAEFLKKLKGDGKVEWIYLLRGRVIPEYDQREFGVSKQLAIKALEKAYGISNKEVSSRLNKVGDVGLLAEEFANKRKQEGLFNSKLETGKVFDNLHKIFEIEGKGAVDKKMLLIAELLSHASGLEAKYVMRTILSDLRIGVAGAILVDALAKAFSYGEDSKKKIQETYDFANDFLVVFEAAVKGEKALGEIKMFPGRPINPMLAVKCESIEEAFETCGRPCAFEYKYDGFRLMIHKVNGRIYLFTRRLEDVTKQFPDVVEAVEKYIKGESFIIDSEAVGYDPKTGKYKPFEAVSQRIKRKYDIEKLVKELPVVLNVFDILYYENKSIVHIPFKERREFIEKIVRKKENIVNTSELIITDKDKDAEKFYEKSLEDGEEGIMIKRLDAVYQSGRKVGYMAKLKPEVNDLDLVIVAAEYGNGKRAGWLTSYIVACRNGAEFLEIGKVSSGLKEKESEGTSYEEMTKLLKSVKLREEGNVVYVKPKIVVSVTYQNMQKSPEYTSGYALRFPRITHYRPDRGIEDIASLKDIEKIVKGK
ncbi:MAG: ATP-dependent DNA ligase [Nanoarchaeota archaeon]|nr:ATP-dependent DNA ligase [Nanoarchaeota archaeon]